MPAMSRIDPQRRIVFSKAFGTITDEEMLDHQRRLAVDEAFRPDFRQIYDFRGVTGLDATVPGVRQLAEHNPWGRGARRAIVAQNRTIYGMARMFQMMGERGPDRIEVFDKLEDALDWLGLEDAGDLDP